MATYGVLQFLFAPVWGSVSDRIGRKPVLIIGVLGNAIAQLLFGLSTQLWMLFAARALAGMLSVATQPTAMAYIGDSTSREKRSCGMGMVGAAMGIGMVFGPGLGGLLAKNSLSFPFFLASALSMLALGFIFIFLPESSRQIQVPQNKAPTSQQKAMLVALASPLGISFISRQTEAGQAITMGLSNSFLSLGRVVGPLWAGIVYDLQMNLPYLTGAMIMLAGFFISLKKLPAEKPIAEPQILE